MADKQSCHLLAVLIGQTKPSKNPNRAGLIGSMRLREIGGDPALGGEAC
jgi:hypothetical protein